MVFAHCLVILGAGLGRLEARVAIESLLARFPQLAADDNAPTPLQSVVLFGWSRLAVRMTADSTAALEH
jgi:cytochrome P450